MARVTVEDCIDKVDNRFKLVLLATHRARMISGGAALTIDRDRDKNPVVALREIAEETVSVDDLEEGLIHARQERVEVDEPDPEPVALLSAPSQDRADDIQFAHMSEEDLLKGLDGLTPPTEPSEDD